MSPESAQQSGWNKGMKDRRPRKLQGVPGLRVAIVAFVLVVLLGGSGVAVAMWNQSATATIAITAAAPPPGTILSMPKFGSRPATVQFPRATCKVGYGNTQNARFVFSWSGGDTTTTGYVVTLMSNSESYNRTETVEDNQASFDVRRKIFGGDDYILRVQPMNGGIVGDPSYKTVSLSYYLLSDATCSVANKQDPPPAPFKVSTVAPVPGPSDSVLKIGWSAPTSGASSYVVSLKANDSSYGTELITTTRAATLTFPSRIQNGVATAAAPFYGDYTLRIQPMNGAIAGDPVYKVVRYGSKSLVLVD